MGKRAEILEAIGAATPALRRYARALCAGADAAVADDLVQSALQSFGARLRTRETHASNAADARIEAYAALTELAGRKLAGGGDPKPSVRHPAIVHSLADLSFQERAALLLVALEGFGYDAAARICGAPREATLARLMRARAVLAAEDFRPSDGARRAASHLRIVK